MIRAAATRRRATARAARPRATLCTDRAAPARRHSVRRARARRRNVATLQSERRAPPLIPWLQLGKEERRRARRLLARRRSERATAERRDHRLKSGAAVGGGADEEVRRAVRAENRLERRRDASKDVDPVQASASAGGVPPQRAAARSHSSRAPSAPAVSSDAGSVPPFARVVASLSHSVRTAASGARSGSSTASAVTSHAAAHAAPSCLARARASTTPSVLTPHVDSADSTAVAFWRPTCSPPVEVASAPRSA